MKWVLVTALAGAVVLAGGCGDDSGGDANSGGTPNLVNGMPGGDATGMPGGDTTGMPGGDVPGTMGAGMGAPPTGNGVPGCEAADTTAADLHGAAAAVLTPESPCGFGSCHLAPNPKALLLLKDVTDLTPLVGMASCEAPNLPIIDGSGGDAGLANSFLWQKLTAEADPSGMIVGDASWGTPGNCGQAVGSYGARMPLGAFEIEGEGRLGPIRNWICAGAPGPGM